MGDAYYSGLPLASRALRSVAHVYVATPANGGLDSNPGTLALPKATLSAAFALIPVIQDRSVCIHLGAGSFAWPVQPPISQRTNALVAIVGDEFAVQASGTIDSGSSVVMAKTTGLVAGAHIGHTFELLSGVGIGIRKTITDNTVTDIRMPVVMRASNGNTFAPSLGDTFRITRPAASITNAAGMVMQYGGTRISLVNVSLADPWGTGRGQTQYWFGVELLGVLHLSDKLYAGVYTEPFGLTVNSVEQTQAQQMLATALNTTVGFAWMGWGLAQLRATHSNAMVLSPGALFEGYLVSPTCGLLDACPQAEVLLLGGRLTNISGSSGQVTVINDSGFAGAPLLIAPVAANAPSGGIAAIGGMRVSITGDVEITCAPNVSAIAVADGGDVSIRGSMMCSGASTAYAVTCSGSLSIGALTASLPNGGGVLVQGAGRAFIGTYTGADLKGSLIQDGGELTCRYFTEMGATGPGLTLYGGRLSLQGSGIASSLTVSATAPGSAAVVQRQGGEIVAGFSATCSVSNLSTAASSDGMRLYGGARALFAGSPNISTAGSSGYGVNCRGGGVFMCASQPTNVVGPTADFSVSATAGDDFADTALAASLSSKVSGASMVARSA